MTETTPIHVHSSTEIEEALADNGVTIADLLAQQGVPLETEVGSDPASGDDGNKEAVTIILATAGLVMAATPLLKRGIRPLVHKSVVATERVLVPVEDSQGNVVRDAEGQPVLRWIDRSRLIESAASDPNQKIEISGFGIELKLEES